MVKLSAAVNKIIRKNEHLAVIDQRVIEGAGLYPGMAVIRGTTDKQVKIATENDNKVLGILLEKETDNLDVDSEFTPGDVVRVLSIHSKGVGVNVRLLKNAETIVRGQKLTVSADPFYWCRHPNNLRTVDGTTAVKSTAQVATFSGYRDNPSYIIADESYTKEDVQYWLEAII